MPANTENIPVLGEFKTKKIRHLAYIYFLSYGIDLHRNRYFRPESVVIRVFERTM